MGAILHETPQTAWIDYKLNDDSNTWSEHVWDDTNVGNVCQTGISANAREIMKIHVSM